MRSVVLLVLCCVSCVTSDGANANETAAKDFLENYNRAAMKQFNAYTLKGWDTGLSLIDHVNNERFKRDMRTRALQFNESAMSYDTSRQLSRIKNIGTAAQPNEDKVKELATVVYRMYRMFRRTSECHLFDCLFLYQESMHTMEPIKYHDGLLRVWIYWRNQTGRKMVEIYSRYANLSNEAVTFLGYSDLGEQWRSDYESDNFTDEVKTLYEQVRALYDQLHAYVRRRLQHRYGVQRFPSTGHIPAHILGRPTSVNWADIYSLVIPFENKTEFDITQEMIRQNYTVLKMFKTAENFYTSLGFQAMDPTFWNKSRLTSDDGVMSCLPMAYDFYDKKDFRIQMCTYVTHSDFITVQHEVGHIAYFMEYKDQPMPYRVGANHAFHEAFGNMITLSFQTPEHLKKLGLIDEIPTDNETDINFLMQIALQTVGLLPFAYVIDVWRWSVFNGSITEKDFNDEWWRLRCELQGVAPPVPRSGTDFDPRTLIHIVTGLPFIRYFLAIILQFQFHKAACQAANHKGLIHRCDIYGNANAGRELRNMLKLGASQSWLTMLKRFTGTSHVNITPLLEYFDPLIQFLKKENGNDTGWKPRCSPSFHLTPSAPLWL